MAQQFFIKAEDYASVKGKVAVITGGSSGIGLATAKVLLKAGAKVVVGDLNECPIKHENLSFIRTNVTDWSNLLALFAHASEKYGQVDHTFANAGVSDSANYLPQDLPSTATLEEPSTRTFDINLRACVNTAYIGIHYLRTQGTENGSITLTASASSFQVFGITDYTSAKHGLLGFMRGLLPNVALLSPPIRVNCIGPSWTLTGMVTKELCEKTGLEAQEAEVVGKQVAVLMADSNRQGEFIYSVGGKHFEIEKSVLAPAAKTACGSDGELEGWEKLKRAFADNSAQQG